MKRALAVCTVLAVLGFSAFGIGTFTGKWEASILLIGTGAPKLETNKLTLNYTDFGWTFTGVLSILGGTSDTFSFTAKGAFGPLSLTGRMWFDFDAAAYEAGDLATSLDFAGLGVGVTVRHWMSGKGRWANEWYPDTDPCSATTYTEGMQYIINLKVDPISVKTYLTDCNSSGITWTKSIITLTGIGICCGISADATLTLTQAAGFDSVKFTVKNIFSICCGISFDASVTFTTTGKTVTLTPKFAKIGEACFEVYADLVKSGGQNADLYIYGIRIDGWKIKCTIADCNYVEFVTFLSPDKAGNYGYSGVFDSEKGEFEYIKLGFCGVGCCGGQYSVGLSVFFGSGGTLFDITRLAADMSIPVMSSLTVKVSFSNPPATLEVGWVFSF